MENEKDPITPLFERLQEFGKTSYELVKLRTLDKVVRFLSSLMSRFIMILVLSVFLVFLNIGLAIWFGQICGELYLGFFCVAGIYGFAGGVLFLFCKKWLQKKVANSIIKKLLM